MVLLIDNYDSFVHNLARYLRQLGEEVEVVRNDALNAEDAAAREPSHLVLSPGPCTPAEAGVSCDLVRELAGRIPILGVCLGHQCIGEVFGGDVVRASAPVHGKISEVHHEGSGLFEGLPSPLRGTRYHSLVVARHTLPETLRITAWTSAGEVMALAHRELPAWGVQFHPEALLTEHGHALLANFLALGRGEMPLGLAAELPPPEIEPAEMERTRLGPTQPEASAGS